MPPHLTGRHKQNYFHRWNYDQGGTAAERHGLIMSMRGIDTPVRQKRRRVFREVADLAYHSTNMKD